MPDTCLVLAGGNADLPADAVPSPAFVIAADGGLALADRIGVRVDLLVGDLDSVDDAALRTATEQGTLIERHPRDKDATDLELALDVAHAHGCRRVIVIGGASPDRMDHLLANAGLLAARRYAHLGLEWWLGTTRIAPLHDTVRLEGDPGDTVSIIPVGGPATVSTTGLAWALDDSVLDPHSSRSVSNRLTAAEAEITASSGAALVVHTRGTS